MVGLSPKFEAVQVEVAGIWNGLDVSLPLEVDHPELVFELVQFIELKTPDAAVTVT